MAENGVSLVTQPQHLFWPKLKFISACMNLSATVTVSSEIV